MLVNRTAYYLLRRTCATQATPKRFFAQEIKMDASEASTGSAETIDSDLYYYPVKNI